jgi:hypothetical protein
MIFKDHAFVFFLCQNLNASGEYPHWQDIKPHPPVTWRRGMAQGAVARTPRAGGEGRARGRAGAWRGAALYISMAFWELDIEFIAIAAFYKSGFSVATLLKSSTHWRNLANSTT